MLNRKCGIYSKFINSSINQCMRMHEVTDLHTYQRNSMQGVVIFCTIAYYLIALWLFQVTCNIVLKRLLMVVML